MVRGIGQTVVFINYSSANHFLDLTVKGLHTFDGPLFHRIGK